MNKSLIFLLFFVWAGSMSVTTYGYEFLKTPGGRVVKWSSPSVTMTFNGAGMPLGSSGNAYTQHAMWLLNHTAGSSFAFYYNVADYSPAWKHNDGVNTIGFLHSMYFPSGVLATTTSVYKTSSGQLVEADIAFNNGIAGIRFFSRLFSWRYSIIASCSDGDPYSFTSVAIHELGHVIGLDHEDALACVMNTFYGEKPLGPSRKLVPNADDCAGVRSLYPKSVTALPDLVAGHNSRQAPIAVPTSGKAGGTIQVGYNFHNVGSKTVILASVGIYLSTNPSITTSDRRIHSFTAFLVRPGPAYEGTRTVVIPRDVSPGIYYVGYIIDYTKIVGELDEANNSSSFCQAAIRVYPASAAEVASGTSSSEERLSTALEPNSPNPFNPTTTIRFSLAESGPVELRVFNVRGELVRTLASGNLSAGVHALEWDGRDDRGNLIASGVYFYRLSAADFAQTRKMLLLK